MPIPDAQDRGRQPKGAGVANAPAGGFTVEPQVLVDAAADWDAVATRLREVATIVQRHGGHEDVFGIGDPGGATGAIRAALNDDIRIALLRGGVISNRMGDGLVETANDYADTDTYSGENFTALGGR